MKVGFVGWRGMVGSVLMQRMKEEKRFGNVGEVVFFFHTLHQNRTDHAAPADETYFHVELLRGKLLTNF